MPSYHPLDPLSLDEIKQSSDLLSKHFAPQPVYFKSINLDPPAKKSELVPWLEAAAAGQAPGPLPRRVEALIALRDGSKVEYLEVFFVLSGGAPSVKTVPVPRGHHVGLDEDEMIAAEQALLANPEFQEAIKGLRLPEGTTVVADSWTYGAETREEMPRLFPFMLYARLGPELSSNHYAFPLPLQPVLDSHDNWKLIELGWTPIFGGDSMQTLADLPGGTFPWEEMKQKEFEYDAEIRASHGYNPRNDLKPLQVIQPEGVSFQVDGRVVSWQKWKLHIGFNLKEGIVLSDIRYDGRLLFHRLSISDMTVPYGDPRAPFHRKQAFDFGDVGCGLTSNNLQLGCDCLGEIFYFDWAHVSSKGVPIARPNVVCLHEQDEGIGWKHTNFRNGKASVTRRRALVIQQVITVANYEYIFNYRLTTAAEVELEVRATGILSTHIQVPGEQSPYGIQVAPGVFAPNHQHIFSVRIDPAIDGYNNTVVQEDSVPMSFSAANPPANNLYGVGYTVEKTPITQAGFADAAPHKNRVFKIINPHKKNPISGRNVSYKLIPDPSQLLIAHPESIAYARAEFAQRSLTVTQHRDDEIFAGGKYTVQSSGNVAALGSWAARKDKVEDEDIIVWHSFGLTHNVRVEDFPVMPVAIHMIKLIPNDFFNISPAIDVPASTQKVNQSKSAVLTPDADCCKVKVGKL